jgi:cytidine deaminase
MQELRGEVMEREALLAAARAAAEHAYAPYSRFRVGAVAVMKTPDGERMASGANVENASFGLTICAERVALAGLFQQHPAGETPHVVQVAVACIDAPEGASGEARAPCGACRQWLAELAPDAAYYVDGIARDLTLRDLLPLAFQLKRKPRSQRTHLSSREPGAQRSRQSTVSSKRA